MRLFKFLILTFSLQFIMSCNSLPVNKKVYSFSKTTNAVQIEKKELMRLINGIQQLKIKL